MSSERRNFNRINFSHPCVLTALHHIGPVEVHDLSLKGALVSAPTDWQVDVGTPCVLEVKLGDDARIRLIGSVVHVDARGYGIHCESIDLDSISHLRRLVELNLGDETLLQRDLHSLVRGD